LEGQGLQGVRVQQYGTTQDLLIRISNADAEATEEQKIAGQVKTILQKENPTVEIRRTEFVGSEVGAQLFEQGGIAVLVSIIATMIYIAFRFEYRLAVSAAVGLIHDAVLILGIFSTFGFEFDLATLASVLAVLGYSLNDTIVVFDRVRENFRKIRKGTPAEIMNLSINQTLSRTVMTSLLTLLVVLALLFFGGETLFGFSMAFFVGIIIATVSSIYVSGALALWLGLTRADLMPKAKIEHQEGP
jgi:preprotein translocase subunit SecF